MEPLEMKSFKLAALNFAMVLEVRQLPPKDECKRRRGTRKPLECSEYSAPQRDLVDFYHHPGQKHLIGASLRYFVLDGRVLVGLHGDLFCGQKVVLSG